MRQSLPALSAFTLRPLWFDTIAVLIDALRFCFALAGRWAASRTFRSK
ncbi:hypothetical protein CCP3SC15_3300002 [Gammaproteobacteria bacterium]